MKKAVLENRTPQFKRALRALIHVMEIIDELEPSEHEIIIDIMEEISLDLSTEGLFDAVNRAFADYEDYGQINDGFTTGIWISEYKRVDNGKVFVRYPIGNEFSQPKERIEMMNLEAQQGYTAELVSKFFVPLSSVHRDNIDETRNFVVAQKAISRGGEHQQLGTDVANFGLGLLSAKNSIAEAKQERKD